MIHAISSEDARAQVGPGATLMLSGNQIASVIGGMQAFTNPALAEMLVSRLQMGSGGIPTYFLSERGQRSAAKQ
jgi:hypothetical protein